MPNRSYLAVLAAAVLCYAALGAVLRVLPELVDDPAALGLLVGAPALTGVLTRPAGGGLADRVGPAPVMLAGAALMFVNVGYVALLAFGGASAGTALVVPVFAAGVVAVRTLGGSLPDRLGGGRTIVVASPLAAAGLLVVALGGGPGVALAGTALLAVGQGLAVPALGLLALARVPAASHGAAAGLFFAFFDAGVGTGGPLVGGVARLTSPAGALVVAAGAVAAAGVVGAGRERERTSTAAG